MAAKTLLQKTLIALFCCAATSLGAFGQTGFQPQGRFETAIREMSTSPYYVLVTIVDDRNGQSRTGCITANLFTGAIHLENGLGYDPASIRQAQEIELNNPAHVFHFSKQAALDNMPLDDKRNAEACAIIARGQSARQADRSGTVYAVP